MESSSTDQPELPSTIEADNINESAKLQSDNSENCSGNSSSSSDSSSNESSSSGSCESSSETENLLKNLGTVISQSFSENAERYTNRPPSIMASFEADLGKLPLEANSAEVYIRTVRRTLDTTDIIKCAKEDVPDVVVEGGVPAVHVMSLFLLGLVEFLCGNALSILSPFYTTEAASKGLSVTASSAVFATVFILQIVFTPIFGRYITSIGSIRLLVVGSIVSGLANIGFGFVSDINDVQLFFWISILMRSITALGESAINTAVYPLARSMAPAKYASTAMSCMETSFGLGTMMGPFLGGVLYELGGFYLPFLFCGIMLGLSGIVAGLLIYCWIVKKEQGGGILDFVPVRVKYRDVITKPGVLIASIVLIFSGMSTQWYQPTMEPYLSSQFNISPFKASLFLVIDGAVYAVISPVWGLLLDKRMDVRVLLMLGSGLISVSFIILGPVFLPLEASLAQVGVSMGVHGLGMGANFIGTLILLTREIEKGENVNKEQAQGLATSLWITNECIGSFIGSALGGLTYDKIGWEYSCLVISLIQFIGLILCLFHREENVTLIQRMIVRSAGRVKKEKTGCGKGTSDKKLQTFLRFK
ncbi:MFS-type transporter SLC18B1 [Eurytemora carolleeae]|uniref:MFS-type transporter SLC18B1 n=1 Tax=Eurytemora carolleeae TaxID=1294199 RepID=UPI000C7561A4|nr:MFS-type transporter SLC18B1 [Eurytemora carolleeae]|eukprot:XP_023337240.1 MFS-type transporter SLC18B1-like [Eurytemora affinis]